MKIKWGALMVDGRGKIGGQVASKNRSGAYMRNKVTPSNPQTSAQQENRALLGNLSSRWSILTDAQRASFNNAVGDYAKSNIFGDKVNPSGKNLFTSLNKNLVNVGLAQVTTAPAKLASPIIGLTAMVVDISSTTITPTVAFVTAGSYYIIRATAPQTNGTSFVKGLYRQIATPQASAIVPIDLWTAYRNRFGTPALGMNIFFEVQLVSANGTLSVVETIKALVQI